MLLPIQSVKLLHLLNKFLNAFNIAQKNIESCTCVICDKVVVGRATDLRRHMIRHNPNTKFAG